MAYLPPTASIRLQIHGSLELVTTLLDLGHDLSAYDVGPSHGGYSSDEDFHAAIAKAHLETRPVELFTPACRTERLFENLAKPILDAGLSYSLWVHETTPGGYRYENGSRPVRLVSATPENPVPQIRYVLGTELQLPLGEVEEAYANGTMEAYLRAKRLVADPASRTALVLSREITEWLNIADHSDTPAPGNRF